MRAELKITIPKGFRALKPGETFVPSDRRPNLIEKKWELLHCGPGTYTGGMFIRRIRRKK